MSKNNNNNDKRKAPRRVFSVEDERVPKYHVLLSFEECQEYLKVVRRSFYWLSPDEQLGIMYHMENLLGAFKEHIEIREFMDYVKRQQKK